MANRYDVLATRVFTNRDGEKKTYWTNVGVAFEQRDGKGFNVNLHCVPVPDRETGEIRLVIREPQQRDERGGGGASGGGHPAGDQDIPFALMRGEL